MFYLWKQRQAELEAKINNAKKEIKQYESHAQERFQHGQVYKQKANDYFTSLLLQNGEEIESFLTEHLPPLVNGWIDWEEERWLSWKPTEAILAPQIRIGENIEQRELNGLRPVSVPHYAPFISLNKTIIILSDDSTNEEGLALLQSLAIRTALMLPHQARYTLLDPAGNGAAFPMRRYLPQVRETGDDVRRDLDEVIKEIRRINETFLDADSDSFELVPEELRVNERFEFIFAADFPNQYDRRAIEALQSIANTGTRTGKYLFIHYNQSYELPRDMNLEEFKNAAYITLNNGYSRNEGTACNFIFYPDQPPSAQLQSQLFEKLRQAKPPERKLDWDDVVGIPEEEWWSQNAAKIIETPIGRSGSSDLLHLWFGENSEGRPCAHGMLGAMTGGGKSNLYHVLILGLATRYSPEELRMYLIDGKNGVEFQPYRHLPHAEVVSLHSPPELSRSVLSELISEKERRNRLFAKVGVVDLPSYRSKGQPEGKLARIILLVDEYQELFVGDQDGIASKQLLQLAQQGRSAGIHMLLASQRFGAAGMMNQTAIFGNVHLRMAMKMTDSDRQALTEFGRRGKQLIMTCDLPGKIVINDEAGNDGEGANRVGKVAFLSDQRRQELLQTMRNKARQKLSAKDLPMTVIFDGKAQPNLIENPQLHKILEQPRWMTPKEWQKLARQSIYDGGLDRADWFSAERPNVIWLGQEFSVRGQAMIILRRRLGENVLIIGANNAARYGMLAAILTSLAINANPKMIQFIILDRSMPETDWCTALPSVCKSVLGKPKFSAKLSRDGRHTGKILEFLLRELDKRSKQSEDKLLKLPSIFVMMTELERVDELRRQDDGYGLTDSPLGQQLQRLYSEGSRLGIHLILSFSNLRSMISVLDERRGLVNFRHRVALQMSEDDSFTFVQSRDASRLQLDGNVPICGLYKDVENDKTVRFKPYSIESNIPWEEQLDKIGNRLVTWSKK